MRLVPADDIKKYRNGKDVLHDGCLHLHAAPPLPWSLVDEFDLPLVDGKHAFPRSASRQKARDRSRSGASRSRTESTALRFLSLVGCVVALLRTRIGGVDTPTLKLVL